MDGAYVMSDATTVATIADLYRVQEKAELVHGRIVVFPPATAGHGRSCGTILQSLIEFEDRTGNGIAFPDNVGFIVDLPHRRSFSPDAAYFFGTYNEEEFVDGAPAFAAEVRSPEDFGPAAERAIAAKRVDYFAAGTQVVWDVDMLREKVVRVYRSTNPNEPTTYAVGQIAEAEPAVSGWIFPVDRLLR
jgi:Uma2 family endonuclease